MMRFLTVTLAALALSATRPAAQDKSKAVLAGVGATSCAEYAEEYRRNPQGADPVFFSWAQGFMSGLNLTRMALKQPIYDLSAVPLLEQQTRLRQLCDKSPLAPYAYAVEDLIKAFPEIPPQSK